MTTLQRRKEDDVNGDAQSPTTQTPDREQTPETDIPLAERSWFSPTPETSAAPQEQQRTPVERDTSSTRAAGETTHSLATWTKKALYERAKQLKVAGRSKMTKDELVRALVEFPPGELHPKEQPTSPAQRNDHENTDKYRERLRRLREEAVREFQRSAEAIPQDITAPGDLAQTPSHPADRDSEGVERELSIARTEKSQIEQIDAALERLHAGTFGKCERCGKTISEARLNAVPYAAYCAECAAKTGSTA